MQYNAKPQTDFDVSQTLQLVRIAIMRTVCSPSARYDDLEPTDIRVQYLWEALTNFTNGEYVPWSHYGAFILAQGTVQHRKQIK